nr:hypothetical protein [Tanacetum cinerariifolium]
MASKSVASPAEIETKQDLGEVESKRVMSAKGPPSGVTGRYLSTDFAYLMPRSNVAHNFLRLKEGGIYSIKIFVVHRNKEEYRIQKNDTFMIEFDGATSIRKTFVKPGGFVLYSFQLVDINGIEPTHNKYLIDVVGYITNVGRTTYQKTGFQNLDFYFANHRSSSIMIFDDADIPAVKSLMTNMPASVEESKKFSVPVDHSAPREGTFENLLMWARNRKNDVRIANVRTRKGWNSPSRGRENCKKGATRNN